MRFQTGTSKMLDSKMDLNAHTVEAVKSQIATSQNSNCCSGQEGIAGSRKMIGEITNCDFTDHLRYALFPDHFRLAMILYTIAQIQIDQCLVLDANVSECRISSTNPGSLGKSGDDPQSF